ncbi:DUF4386 domain-containing protein [Kribbella sp. NPDC023972]|uniref:DUF4386 domain-containing protein n=1 Tax=Kribbella sp. NPDC023972 TaxID=3154795 RepID=UPI0033DA655B
MSNTTIEGHSAPVPPRTHKREPGAASIRQAGLFAGVGILVMAALSGFGIFYAGEGLMTQGDPARTVEDIAASDGLFRWGTASLYAVVVLDVVVAWALFRFFSPVSSGLARLAAWFRLAYAGIFMLAIGQLAGIPDLVASDEYSRVFTAEQIQGQSLLKINAFEDLWMAGLILFGIHLALVGYLAYRSGYVPKLLGVLLVIAGAGYVFDSVLSTVLASPPGSVATVTFLGEFLLALWLVTRGRRISLEAEGHGL